MYFTTTRVKKIVRYTEDFIIKRGSLYRESTVFNFHYCSPSRLSSLLHLLWCNSRQVFSLVDQHKLQKIRKTTALILKVINKRPKKKGYGQNVGAQENQLLTCSTHDASKNVESCGIL